MKFILERASGNHTHQIHPLARVEQVTRDNRQFSEWVIEFKTLEELMSFINTCTNDIGNDWAKSIIIGTENTINNRFKLDSDGNRFDGQITIYDGYIE